MILLPLLVLAAAGVWSLRGQREAFLAAQSAAGAESLLRLLGAAAQLASRGVPGQAALHMASHSPDLDAETRPFLPGVATRAPGADACGHRGASRVAATGRKRS